LLHPYLLSVFAVVRSVLTDHADAEDTAQEAVLRAFSHLDQLRSGHALPAWLFQVAINEARMLRRRNARRLCFESVDETTLTQGHVQRMVSGTERTRGTR
jgi:RNA polymerase sigma-70 factor (ECF subfamily)